MKNSSFESGPTASLEQWKQFMQSTVKADLMAIYERRIETLVDALEHAETLEQMKLLQEIKIIQWSRSMGFVIITIQHSKD